jgi:folate-binding protein YgfZ
VRALFLLGAGEKSHHLDLEARFAPDLARALEAFLFGERVEIEESTGKTRALGVLGERSSRALASIGIADPPHLGRFARAATPLGEVEVARLDALAEPFFVLRASHEVERALLERLLASDPGARRLDAEALETLRIEAGIPRYGTDVDETFYPQEATLEGAFSVSKGCYPGQEVAARLQTYQGFQRRRVGLVFEGDEAPDPGDVVRDEGGDEVGRVTSATRSRALGCPIAFAVVKKESGAPGTALRVARGDRSLRAAVASLPFGRPPSVA